MKREKLNLLITNMRKKINPKKLRGLLAVP